MKPLEPECPVCGVDVSGCTRSVGDDGLERFTQPVKWERLMDGRERPAGGLVHIVGGERCLSDARRAEVARLKKALVWQARGYCIHNTQNDERPCLCAQCENVRECLEGAMG